MTPDSTPGVRAALPARIGRYTIAERIGKGAMGVVYSALDERHHRWVALKVLAADLECERDIQARFYREARLAAQLQHRNIVTVLDVGEDDGKLFFAMELLRGATLGDYLRANPGIGLEEKLDLMTQVCEGLSAAHGRGVYHRDIKPGNLFVQHDGSLKLLDFGIARLANSTLTSTGLLLGTPEFMSPEQARGGPVDGRSDLFSAAAVFYLMLTGRKPFDAADLPGILHKVASCDPAPLTPEEAPPELSRIIFKALSKEPAKRHQRVAELQVDLVRFRRKYDAETCRRGQAAAAAVADLRGRRAECEALAVSLRLEPCPAPAPDPLLPWHEKHQLLAERGEHALEGLYLRRAEVDAIDAAVEEQRARTLSELARLQAASRNAATAAGLESEDPRQALRLYERTLEACSESRFLQEGAKRCQDSVARQERLQLESERLRVKAREAVNRRDWGEALAACDEGLGLVPNDPSLLGLGEAARSGRDRSAAEALAAETAAAVAAARKEFSEGARDEALQRLRGFLESHPENREAAAELKSLGAEAERIAALARRMADAARLGEEAEAAWQRLDADAALHLVAQVVELEPGNVIAARIRTEVRAFQRVEEERAARRQRARARVEAARRFMARRRWAAAVREAEAGLEMDPGVEGAPALIADARRQEQEEIELAERRKLEARSAPGLLARFRAAPPPVRYGAILGGLVTLAMVAIAGVVVMRGRSDRPPSAAASVQGSAGVVEPASVPASPPPPSPVEAPVGDRRPEAGSSRPSAEGQVQGAAIRGEAPGIQPGADPEVRRAANAQGPRPSFAVTRREGEREPEYRARARALQARYERARSQLENEDAAGAVATLEALLGDEPGQPDAQDLLTRARELDGGRKRAEAQAAFDAAAAREAAGELREAEQQYAALRGVAAAPPGVDEAIARVRERRVELGNRALANAKQFHSIGSRHGDAAREYERAMYLLPDDHPNHALARERLDALRGVRR